MPVKPLLPHLAGLRVQILRRIGDLLPAGEPYALVDFPNYPNVGDSAIYLGQLECLRALHRPPPRYTCDFRSHDPAVMRSRIGRGPILLTGGGSFGDLWPTGQAFRESILREFRDNPIVQLPQTLYFRERASLEQARRVVNAHSNFTLLVRDARSLELARNEFNVPAFLCPDMAFCLGPLARPRLPLHDVLWLARGDKESAITVPPYTAHRADWSAEQPSPLRDLSWRLSSATHHPLAGKFARAILVRMYEPLARQRLRRGLELLATARVVITDRLHGHVLSMLLGIPHVVVDNSYGKLSAFHEAWTAGVEVVHLANSAEGAWVLARELAGSIGEVARA